MAPTGEPDSDDEEIWGLLAGSAEEAAPSGPEGCVAAGEAAARASSSEGGCPAEPSAPAAAVAAGAVEAPCSAATGSAAVAAAAGPAPIREPPGFRAAGARVARIPAELLQDPEINAAIAQDLPATHDFEVHRTIWRLRRCGARHVGLQMPEGLQHWATRLADIVRRFVPSVESTTIFGDVTFGACCIDDLAARALGVDFLVHYGHSCIVPTDQTTVATLYVLVEIQVDVAHLVATVRHNFAPQKKLALMGSVQFKTGIAEAAEQLRREFFAEAGSASVPQVKPLGVGETLGCTSPAVGDVDAVVFVCDGRFHLESAMIQNPHVPDGFFRYDPGEFKLTREGFAHGQMHKIRRAAIEAAKGASMVGLILGTLGRQGSPGVLEEVERLLDRRGTPHLTLLVSEISPERLALFRDVGAWVQVACPRLSLDWGEAYSAPLLTPYEAHVAFGDTAYQDVYPMDYYSNRGGPWSNYGAHNGHGGSLGKKFSHLRNRKYSSIEYEEPEAPVH